MSTASPHRTDTPSAGRIDTHCHVVPPAYRDWLERQPGYPGPYIDWSRQAALDFFESNRIAAGILSISTPGARLPGSDDRQGARRVARMANEFCAETVRSAPASFGFFATLTLPDVDGAIAEAAYCLDELDADGIVLLTNTDGVYAGSPRFDPLLEFLNDRAAVVFIHPTGPATPPALPGVSPGVIEFLHDSVRAAVNLARNGCPQRFPELKFLLSHGGGYLPYAATRIALMAFPGLPPADALAHLRRLSFDTALTSPDALASLLNFADPAHVTFGTDWPYASSEQAAAFIDALDSHPLTTDQTRAITRGNAERLFPRLAARQPA
jgi:predicted TIM-barrel fold metal-dependent hydrolase